MSRDFTASLGWSKGVPLGGNPALGKVAAAAPVPPAVLGLTEATAVSLLHPDFSFWQESKLYYCLL